VAHIDPRTDEIVLRIVYDGAPHAGKTTNVRVLHESLLTHREGTLESPESTGRATAFFDYRDFMGGYLEGRRLRCQVVSVPGQTEHAQRRRYLLGTADSVVLVVDSDPAELERSRAVVRSSISAVNDPAVPMLLQVNKLDREGALALDGVLEALRLPLSTQVFGARARERVGVAETFLAAARLASESVRERARRGTLPALEAPASATELHAAMRELE
jgi:signal recognition particle receptor subunit beta